MGSRPSFWPAERYRSGAKWRSVLTPRRAKAADGSSDPSAACHESRTRRATSPATAGRASPRPFHSGVRFDEFDATKPSGRSSAPTAAGTGSSLPKPAQIYLRSRSALAEGYPSSSCAWLDYGHCGSGIQDAARGSVELFYCAVGCCRWGSASLTCRERLDGVECLVDLPS